MTLTMNGHICNALVDCLDEKDETDCSRKTTTLRSGLLVETNLICNDVCENASCEDEAVCNGLIYGLY